jgi:hypothetical protein
MPSSFPSCFLAFVLFISHAALGRDYRFDGSMSEETAAR